MKAYKHLVKHALADGASVTVNHYGEVDLARSYKYTEIIAAIEAVEECTIIFWKGGKNLGSAYILPYLGDDETVADYGINDWMNAWDEAYQATL